MAKIVLWLTILVLFCCIKTFSATPFLWNLFKTTTTTTTAATTASSSSTNSNASANYSETYNYDNNNQYSVPLNFAQQGSGVSGSVITTLDQYLGDVKLNITKRQIDFESIVNDPPCHIHDH